VAVKRWWEARGFLGAVCTHLRSIACILSSLEESSDASSMEWWTELAEWICAFPLLVSRAVVPRATVEGAHIPALPASLVGGPSKQHPEPVMLLAAIERRLQKGRATKQITNSDTKLISTELRGLMIAVHGVLKVKYTNLPDPLNMAGHAATWTFAAVILPYYLAYMWHTPFDSDDLAREASLMWQYVFVFLLMVTLVCGTLTTINAVGDTLTEPLSVGHFRLPAEKMMLDLSCNLKAIFEMEIGGVTR